MKLIIIVTLLIAPNLMANDKMMQFLQTVQQQKNNWDNMHYQHIENEQQMFIRARQGAMPQLQNQYQRQQAQLPECAPHNTYCHQLRQHLLMQQQFDY